MARVKLKRIETSRCSIINIKLSIPIFGLPMGYVGRVNGKSLKRTIEKTKTHLTKHHNKFD